MAYCKRKQLQSRQTFNFQQMQIRDKLLTKPNLYAILLSVPQETSVVVYSIVLWQTFWQIKWFKYQQITPEELQTIKQNLPILWTYVQDSLAGTVHFFSFLFPVNVY